jgi:hypothetical protein
MNETKSELNILNDQCDDQNRVHLQQMSRLDSLRQKIISRDTENVRL